MKYLKTIDELSAEFLTNGQNYLSTGYQQLLARRSPDGSFNMWGEAGASSVWLTAYIAKILDHAKEFIAINDKHIVEALKYVSQNQQVDGSFVDQSHAYIYITSKTQQGVLLTAFSTIAFLENSDVQAQFKSTIDKSLNYIASKISSSNDNLALAISAYVLALGSREETGNCLDVLKANAIYSNGKMHWFRESQSLSSTESPAVNVEIAAYAMMAFIEAGRSFEAVPIMNWLITQRNANGGFYSTTDTVIAIQALSKIAKALYVPNVNMEIKLKYGKNHQKVFNINKQNALELQTQVLEADTRNVEIIAEGRGLALFQLSYRYNVILDETNEHFVLTAVPVPTTNQNLLNLNICANFLPVENMKESGMTLIEVYLPSGFVYDPQTAESVKSVGVRVC